MEEKRLLLDIQDLSIRYETEGGAVHAVEHLNLSLAPGENLGFVGETGAGKPPRPRDNEACSQPPGGS